MLVADRGISFLFKRLAISAMAALLISMPAHSALASAPAMHGRAALLLDGQTGQVLFDYNGNVRNFPASTTKLLTALVAVEHGKLDQVVKVSAKAVDQAPDSSSCYLNRGEDQKLEHLLIGLLLVSGNDCAVAIAEGVAGGNAEQFVSWMNETAKRVGAVNSQFTNPHGLHEAGHYTTAHDLALIAQAALSNRTVEKIATTKEFNWPGKNNGTYYNHNAMLFTYEHTSGGKTGFTEEAGLTLVNTAKKDGRWLIGVVMGEDSKVNQYRDMEALLEYGFANFEHKVVVAAGTPQGNIQVLGGTKEVVAASAQGNVVMAVPRGTEPKVTLDRKVETSINAPVSVGQPVGTLDVREGDRVIATVAITAREAIEAEPPFLANLLSWTLTALKWLGGIALGLLAFRTTVKAIRRVIRSRRRRSAPARPAAGRRTAGAGSPYGVQNRH